MKKKVTLQTSKGDITKEQLILINNAREEVKAGNFYTHEEVMANLRRMLRDNKKRN